MTILYPVPEIFPDPRARFIQIINTCYALAEGGVKVTLIAGIRHGHSTKDVLQFYGLSCHQNLEIVRLPILRGEDARYLKLSWNGVFNISLLLYLLYKRSHAHTDTSIFLRHIKLASFLVKIKKLLNIPIIFETHEIFYLNTLNKKRQRRLEQMEKGVYRNADAVICMSQPLKQYLVDTIKVDNRFVFVVPHAVKREWFDIKREAVGSYICYTGSLYKWKGVDTLISAMRYLPDERLLIVGGGRRLEGLKNFAISEGVGDRIKFIGSVPHSLVPKYLSGAKVVVLPNLPSNESLFSSPLKLFEYMACGIPIAAADIPVFREILVDNRNAVLFKPGNPESLAACINKISQNSELAARLGRAAREDAWQYTYERRAERLVEIIKGIKIEKGYLS